MNKLIAGLALTGGLALVAAPALSQEGGRPLSAHMTGAAEKPNPGDPDGMGHVRLTVNVGQNQICYDIMAEKITLPAGAAHIHKAGPDAAGPPVVMLKPPGADGKVKDCATAGADVVKDILQNPGNYYVNVHTSDFPAGAIRGQISK
jgi:hypothetical protein